MSQDCDSSPPRGSRKPDGEQANLRVDFDVTEEIALKVGVRNAFDDGYRLVDDYPEPGRRFFRSARARY